MDSAARLLDAVKMRDAAVVCDLLTAEPALIRAPGPGGLSMLHFAVYLRDGDVVDALLAAGAEHDAFTAAAVGDVERVRDIVRKDPSALSAQAPDGATMLHLAAHYDQAATVRALLELGAKPDLMAGGAFGNTALHAAGAGGATASILALLEAGASPDLPDKNGFRPLHLAAANGLVEAARALLERGATADARANDGRTPLAVAQERGREEMARLLRERGG